MPKSSYSGRHRAPEGRHRASHGVPRPPTASVTRLTRSGYLLPAAAAATVVLTAAGAHLSATAATTGATTAATTDTTTGADTVGSATALAASGTAASDLITEDPISREAPDRAARDADRSAVGGSDAFGPGDAAAPDTLEADRAERAQVQSEARVSVAQEAAAAAAQADADAAAAAAKAAADAATAAPAPTPPAATVNPAPAAGSHTWVAPFSGAYTLTSGFGMRWGQMHPAQDFAMSIGTPVEAMSSGTVLFAGWQGGYGNKVEIRYWDGTVSWYAHNSKLMVSAGDTVTAGEVVSLSGNTGHSTGPHLHVEIHPGGGDPIPPLPWLQTKGIMP